MTKTCREAILAKWKRIVKSLLKVTSVDDMRFSVPVYTEINRNSIEIRLFAQFLAKLLPSIVIFH